MAVATSFGHYPESITEEKRKHIKSLAQEFFGAPSWNCSINSGDISVLEKWFTELGVGWVLHVADGTSAGIGKHTSSALSWIRALGEIIETIGLMVKLFPEIERKNEARIPDQLIAVLGVRKALSSALAKIRFPIHPEPSAEAARIHGEIVSKGGQAGNPHSIRGRHQKYSSLGVHVAALFEKVEGYNQSYLQVSWAPVPDPEPRKALRTAIAEKIIPDYTKYMEDNNVPKIHSAEASRDVVRTEQASAPRKTSPPYTCTWKGMDNLHQCKEQCEEILTDIETMIMCYCMNMFAM
ncbi:hypothetical protein BAE44_0024419 [Dichanthelium oligosanthes]|uniref:Uncharacterized protein n=1 Tax=Dichanthelium oligosanthes TaxID=888268 RepID=A0A1E5UNV8_9POAL|nr:hypothetical protein BAE44_0024419 [Dichanthelium oligosanthes]